MRFGPGGFGTLSLKGLECRHQLLGIFLCCGFYRHCNSLEATGGWYVVDRRDRPCPSLGPREPASSPSRPFLPAAAPPHLNLHIELARNPKEYTPSATPVPSLQNSLLDQSVQHTSGSLGPASLAP